MSGAGPGGAGLELDPRLVDGEGAEGFRARGSGGPGEARAALPHVSASCTLGTLNGPKGLLGSLTDPQVHR